MKVEIKTDENGIATTFKLNDKDFGSGVRGYVIEHSAGYKPKMTLDIGVNELIIDGENIEIVKPETKDNE